MWEKNKETTKYDKSIIICDIGTIQYGNETVKWRKKKKTTKGDKSIIKYDVGTTKCDNGTIKCEKKKKNHQMRQKNSHMWYWNYTM